MKAQSVVIVFALLLQFATAAALIAQAAPTATDAVHLHSGQTHRGIIVEQKPGESIRLWRIAEGDTLTFGMEQIERIAKVLPAAEIAPAGAETAGLTPNKRFNSNPWVVGPARRMSNLGGELRFNSNPWVVGLQFSAGGGDHSLGGLGAVLQRQSHNQRSWIGLGAMYVGDVNDYATNSVGLFVHGSQEFSTSRKGRFGSLFFMDLGYSFNLGRQYFDEKAQEEVYYGNGLHLHTGLRFRVNVLRNAGLWLDIGFLRHTSTLRTVANDDKVRQKAWNMAVLRGSVFF